MLRCIDPKFVYRPRIYLAQLILTGVVLVGILIAEDALTNGAVVAAVASSVPINSVIFILSAAVIISVVRFALYRHLLNLI
jgi:hypothetical protein